MDYQSIKNLNDKSKLNVTGIVSLAFWLLILVLIFLKIIVFQQVSVVGSSMEPNYQNGQTLLMNQINKNYTRGQVVAVYKDPSEAKDADYFTRFNATFFLKRIIGLPGESIEINKGEVIIYNNLYPNGAILNETYIKESTKNNLKESGYKLEKTLLSNEEYFLMGDNRTNSLDSRNLGPFPEYALFGTETVRIWPLQNTSFFSLPSYSFNSDLTELNSKKED